MDINSKMMNKINIACLLESLENRDAFVEAYEPDRHEMLDSIKGYLGANSGEHSKIMNHINDCIEMTEDELFLMGISTGIQLAKAIRNL